MKIRTVLFLMTLVVLGSVYAAVPGQVSFQGKVNDDVGTPIEGTFSVDFNMYTVPIGGTAVWTETQSVEFRSGLFLVQLGSVVEIPQNFYTGGTFYIEMVVGGETLGERKPMVSVPYAFRAAIADSSDRDWAMTGVDIYNQNTGNVGIGTMAAPTLTDRLHVMGNGEAGERAVVGISTTGPQGWLGTAIYGAYGEFNSENVGALGSSGIGVTGRGATYGGYFEGDVYTTDNLTVDGSINVASTSQFVIDGDAGSEDVLMTDGSGLLYWADGSGIGGDDWGVQVVEADAPLVGDGTVGSPLAIDVAAATDGDVLTFNGGTGQWEAMVAPGGAVSVNPRLEGDGTVGDPLDIAGMGASEGDVMTYSSGVWTPAAPATGADDWGTQVVEVTTRLTGDGTTGSELDIAQQGATDGQALIWDAGTGAWIPGDVAASGDDNYALGATFDTGTGDLVIDMTDPIADITISLDGRYMTGLEDAAWTDAGTYIHPNNAASFHIEDGTGNLDMGGASIEGVNEISANTIDPVLKINGKLFRTWTTDMVGQRTVCEGSAKLDENGEYRIDLQAQPEASNLWLFYHSVDPKTIIVGVTPTHPAMLYARVEDGVLIVGDMQNQPGVGFSYRLSGVRYDFRDMTEEETNIRTKDTDMYIDVDGGARYQTQY